MISKDSIQDMYLGKGMSVMDIAKLLKCSRSRVDYWISKFKIKKRTISQALRTRIGSKTYKPWPIDPELMGVGIGLYLGEGSKTKIHTLKLANTNAKIICIFREYIRRRFFPDESRFRYWLHLYEDLDMNEAMHYWGKKLGITPSRIQTHKVQRRGLGTYTTKEFHGVMSFEINDVALREALTKDIENTVQMYYHGQTSAQGRAHKPK